jgi:protein-tyrosine-phosphatase
LTGSPPYRILFVCTANICRSPAAENLARARFGETTAVFRSAGFLGSGQASPELLQQTLAEQGVDISHHRSYQLDDASLNAADVVLTMEGEHVQRATLLNGGAFAKIMPLKEAADAIETSGWGQYPLAALLDRVSVERDPSSYLSTRWDVDDPYGRKLRDYRSAVAELTELVDVVIGRLT